MFFKIKKIFFFFCLLIAFFFKAGFVFGLEAKYPAILGLQITEQSGFPEYVKYFFNLGMSMAVSVATLAIIFGGIYYLVSLGSGKMTSEGKEWVKSGILGLLILLCSYLIAVTINPNLVAFNLENLPFIPAPPGPGDEAGTINKPPTVTYEEIPIGTLTENLLARAISCYDFDIEANPIDGDPKTSIYEPTFLNHDRLDCILKLADGTVKTAGVFKELSEEIAKLMGECRCEESKGKPECPLLNCRCESNDYNRCPGGKCPEDCKKPCVGNENRCPAEVEKEIEHGPIILEKCPNCKADCQIKCEKEFKEKQKRECDQNCKKQCENKCKEGCEKEYKGLDEFRTQYNDDKALLAAVEKEVEIDGAKLTIIQIDVWKKLRLVDKLKYFKAKMKAMNLDNDLNLLKNAENKLNNCYHAIPYIDFLKVKEETRKDEREIVIKKNFQDPVSKKDVDISRYCKGYQYVNSQCFHTCRNMCPGTMEKDFNCYKGCPKCDSNNKKCLEDQKKCMKKCTDESECVQNPDFNNFKKCMEVCNDKCLENCSKEEGVCAQNIEDCKNKCFDDSLCLWNVKTDAEIAKRNIPWEIEIEENKNKEEQENKGSEEDCYFDFKELKNCVDGSANLDGFKICAEFSFRCKYCSDQYAGYPDCSKTPGTGYSSFYLYDNPNKQKCPQCNQIIDKKTGKTVFEGIQQHPECAKCPSCSKCPKCPCGEVGVLFNRACSGDCSEFNYNDDPLTFYCSQDDWAQEREKQEKPIGKERYCPKEREIPIGQTIDDTEDWAEEVIKAINNFVKKTEDMVEYIIKIGKEKDYCKCNSICEGSEGACGGDCIYHQQWVEEQIIKTEEKTIIIPAHWVCWCEKRPCAGNPCQKMINLLLGKEADDKCPKNVEYIGIKGHYEKIQEAAKKLDVGLSEERSENLKKLIYSRKKTDECSAIETGFGAEVKLLNCERVIDNVIPPIIDDTAMVPLRSGDKVVGVKTLKNHCYGKEAGKILNLGTLADNWFCCEKYAELEKPKQ